jgi:hypothetical protein
MDRRGETFGRGSDAGGDGGAASATVSGVDRANGWLSSAPYPDPAPAPAAAPAPPMTTTTPPARFSGPFSRSGAKFW